ncbi:protein brambleberry-like [Nylanderia fulva]|uniref:protein brambleberry-like n=1 Tax=Nylanderia fulva TaxID=613905 RepID=UPI0010FB772E|nr:protein brambleberry-like [Nylanderia fulva]XP_029167265.1 protein brambleberry-like [Nylanderia fulva]
MLFKMNCKLLLIFIVLCNCKLGSASILDWVWQSKTNDKTASIDDGVPLISIPYEMMTEDEKFLQQAAKFTNIQVSSPLETCQHKVIMKIRTSCSDMTEEELAKLSVNLLNCQSAVEGRKMFPCTEEMSLQQCTTHMDADMWNAYHLMSNRARAVCYAARNTQFRALTELTVNKLMHSAHSQIEALKSLKESQDHLQDQTTEALVSLSKGNKALLEQQEYLKDAQVTAHNLVTSNLRELNNEKALIRSGHTQLAAMAEDIKNKLEKAHKEIEQQVIEHGKNHEEVLEDLISIKEQMQSIWDKIESSTNHILDQHEKTIEHYEQTMQKLAQINNTIQYIWNLTNIMRTEVDKKLGWITDYIGDTGEQLQRMYRIVSHVVYILVAMIIAAFLQAPFLTRASILAVVPVNLVTYLKHGMEASLDFTSMTVLIFLISAMYFVMSGIQQMFGPSNSEAKTQPAKLTSQNGHLNGKTYKYTTYFSSMPKIQLHKKVIKKIQDFYNFIVLQINYYKEKINDLIHLIIPNNQRNLSTHEELSCSYQPLKKNREGVYNKQNFSNMWDDQMDCDSSNTINSLQEDYNDKHFKDIAETLKLKYSMYNTMARSRSCTPSDTRMLCLANTKNGRRCRVFASPGQPYCYHHSSSSSIVDGHLN